MRKAARGIEALWPFTLVLSAVLRFLSASEPPLASDPVLLGYRLQLAQQSGAYLEINEDAITAYVRGMSVKRFPIMRAEFTSRARPRLSKVASKRGAYETRQVIVKVEHVSANPSDSISSPDEIVSVEDMPETFAIRLADGSAFFVTGNASEGLVNKYRKQWLKVRVGCTFFYRQILDYPVRAGIIEMKPQAARQLFWLLRPEMGVIY